MKISLLKITLFSILAILPTAIFAQRSVLQGNAETLWNQMFEQLDKRQFPQLIETATNYLRFQVTERQKIIALDLRSLALKAVYSKKGNTASSLVSELNGTFKFSVDSAEKLRQSVADSAEVINYFTKNPPANDADKNVFASSQYQTGKIYLDLAKFYSHNPEDFAQAEKYLLDSLGKIPGEQITQKFGIIQSLAGQYRFNEAREIGKQLVAETPESTLLSILTNTTMAFVMMGEYNYANAFLLEAAGILKASNKSLKPIAEANEFLQKNQLAVIPNPQTAMELNRQGGLHYLKGEFDKALPLLEKSLNLMGSSTALRWWVMSQADKNIYAKQDNDNLLKADSTDVAGLSLRGMGFVGENQMDKAAADFSKAIEIYPELAFFYNTFENLKEIYRLQNKLQLSSETDAKQKRFADLIANIENSKSASGSPTPNYTDSSDFLEGKPSSTPKPTPTPTSKPVESNFARESGSLDDCKFILSEGCRNFFLQSTVDELRKQVNLYRRNTDGESQLRGEGFYLEFEPSSGGIISVSFYNPSGKKVDRKPAQNLKWEESVKSVRQKYGEPRSVSGRYHFYPGFEITFWDDELLEITFRRERTSSEEDAENARYWKKQRDDEKYANSPEGIKDAYNSMHNQVEANIKRSNVIIDDLNKNNYLYTITFPSMRLTREKELAKLAAESRKLINQFLEKYKGKLPQSMIAHLNEDLAKFNRDSNR